MKFRFDSIQSLGRALMLPISLLPVAGLLLRIGQPDLLNIQYISAAGNVIFANLSVLFAVGVAVGLAKDNNGTAGLASLVGYFIMTTILTVINKDINTGVLGGILIGIIAAALYNRYRNIKLPDYLAFFGGKRFIPIITGLVAVAFGVGLGYIWPPIQDGINIFGHWLLKSGVFGVFIYGVVNRFLLITGLHHILNNLVWFVFGSYTTVSGAVSHGDIARFMAGDKTAGRFMAGYFPIMMFGLPAACLAMYKNALTENKKAVAGLLFSMALTSFLTGVTEPIEYSFVFLAPMLFVIHALLTGASMAVMYLLHVHMGFTFSAGLVDYILFYKLSTNPIYLIPVGIATFAIYYLVFDFFIRKFNLSTIGRDGAAVTQVSIVKVDSRALQLIEALGGSANLISVDACTTRLRLVVNDSGIIKRDMLIMLGAKAVVAPTKETVQVILGPIADIVASEIRETLSENHELLHQQSDITLAESKILHVMLVSEKMMRDAAVIIKALGGSENIQSINLVALTRLRVQLKDSKKVAHDSLTGLERIKLIDLGNNIKHLYAGENARELYWAIEKLIG